MYFAETINCHFGTKCDTISTATGINHQPLPLKSNIIHSIHSDFKLLTSFLKMFSVSSHIKNISIYHIFLPLISNTLLSTDGKLIFSLVIVTSKTSLLSSFSYLSIIKLTSVPAGHLILAIDSSKLSFFTYQVFIAIIRSNGLSPAFIAGDSFKTSSICI
ncbi:MAG: hypothetical protein BWY04_01151 [candidate division CPR1 bacterium ADurb.Bin160]|uniref:Uncharacterized protein n=1 Tax=candidate division CPR1 bacterium ADurb.Bin160 TaxID=1852826 RepID=A0A1V5ZKX7_9BACT|nr:MAG: hypothetical protein BWY04_01151 [candidate division CPR1 bacterium ADurb.Bin160]